MRIEACIAHRRLGEVIKLPVLLAFIEKARIVRDCRPQSFRFCHSDVRSVVEVFLPQHLAQCAQIQHRHKGWELVPGHEQVKQARRP